MTEATESFQQRLTAAIAAGQAAEFVAGAEVPLSDRPLADGVSRALGRISAEMRALKTALCRRLAAEGCPAEARPGPEDSDALQYPQVTLGIAPADLERAAAILEVEGFDPPFELTPGRCAALRRYQSSLRLVRFDGDTTRVALSFGPERGPSKLRPSVADIAGSRLPPALAPLLRLRRLGRVLADRVLGRPKGAADTEYLGTPQSLIAPLLALIGPPKGRHLMDIGCGDGRILVAAAQAGWRATGVELNPDLVRVAQAAVDEAGLGQEVRIVEQAAESADLSDVDVVFLFLPLYILAPVLVGLLNRAAFTGQIIVHEQQALPPGLTPDRSRPVVSDNALTVAHIWGE